MKREIILNKIIAKAIRNGWDSRLSNKFQTIEDAENKEVYVNDFGAEYSLLDILFDHGFARAFWGEGRKNKTKTATQGVHITYLDNEGKEYLIPIWQYHLQQLALEETGYDKLIYVKKYL